MMQKGRSLLEMLIIAGLVALLLGSTIYAFQSFLDAQRMNAAVEGTVTMISKARNMTLSAQDPILSTGSRYGIHVDDYSQINNPNRVIVFKGDIYSPGTAGNIIDTYQLPKGTRILSYAFSPAAGGDVMNFFFERLTGNVVVFNGSAFVPLDAGLGGVIIVQSNKNPSNQKTINFEPTGVIQK